MTALTLRSDAIRAWLKAELSDNGKYRHVHLQEVARRRRAGVDALANIVSAAHQDQREHLAELLAPLDPLGKASAGTPLVDIAALHTNTLQGYLGEILAGVVAVNYDPHAKSWSVPGFTFRFDQDAETELVRALQGTDAAATFGRHGHDCLALSVDDSGAVDAYLACEGKCTSGHRKALIDTAHKQLSGSESPAADFLRLIQVIEANLSSDAEDWAPRLQAMLLDDHGLAQLDRYDLFVYTCGRGPQPPRRDWMSRSRPNSHYKAPRDLEVTEAHVSRIRRLIQICYPGHELADG